MLNKPEIDYRAAKIGEAKLRQMGINPNDICVKCGGKTKIAKSVGIVYVQLEMAVQMSEVENFTEPY